MPVFTFPLAFIALLAVPALIAIYWLRNQSRERRVSSLLLWLDERQMWEGGRRIHRLQTPLLFFLELIAILLLVMAAAGPMMRAGDSGRPLVVVLDDSFSMLAGAGKDDATGSARNRAVRAIESELKSNRYEPVYFALAGESPQLLGEVANNADQAIKLLQSWKCGAPAAKLEEAIAFAFELGGPRARVLAVTDHAPQQELSESRLQWWSFGASQQNFAFVNAARTLRDDEDRILLEIANLSSSSGSTTLSVESENPQSQGSNKQSITIGAGETHRTLLTLKPGAPALRARLSDDALLLDNEVTLKPEPSRNVRVDLRVRDAGMRALVEKAVNSSPNASLSANKPGLVITDESDAKVEDAEAWTLQIVSEKDAASFLGPFVIDRSHPLSEGLSLGGVVWGAGKSRDLAGAPVVNAGDIPLLSDVERAGRHDLRLRLRPDLSTLQESPNWPILIWNLIDWRAQVAPGLKQTNLRLGGDAALTVESDVESVSVIDPRGVARRLPAHDKTVLIKADIAGVYEISANQNKYSFAANALQREESDLTQAASGRWGNWAKATALEREYRSVAWALLLLALIALAVHAWLVARNN
ncbi:MAG TPA: BatA domain-containing protein [Blastocatellia bacterium]|nr:BatA domain-containing protein [Blastocatellia bacterium]